MYDQVWWKHLHWSEYGAELLGTAFLVFAGVSAVVFYLAQELLEVFRNWKQDSSPQETDTQFT